MIIGIKIAVVPVLDENEEAIPEANIINKIARRLIKRASPTINIAVNSRIELSVD